MSVSITSIQLRRGLKTVLENVLTGEAKPLRGEPIWEIDTNQIKIGDGQNNYIDLPYLNGSDLSRGVYAGYYYNGDFYKDVAHTTLLMHSPDVIYLDLNRTGTYYWSNNSFYLTIPAATPVSFGIAKLYTTLGQNTDGSCTQKCISDELSDIRTTLSEKVSVDATQETECLIFRTNNS